ncbi:MAG: hypothetical protein KA745_12450 [Gemmatimonadales bacterium]|nr:hypothetical protein [Gemmatimonadales bacterium]
MIDIIERVKALTPEERLALEAAQPLTRDPAWLSPGTASYLAAERVSGWVDETPMSFDMARGVEDEPLAVVAYEGHRLVTVEPCGFMVRDLGGARQEADVRPVSPARGPETVRRDEPVCAVHGASNYPLWPCGEAVHVAALIEARDAQIRAAARALADRESRTHDLQGETLIPTWVIRDRADALKETL